MNEMNDHTTMPTADSGWRRRAFDVTALLLMAILFFTYFSLITKNVNRHYSKGDASTYTLMVLHMDDPEKIEQTLPIIYSQRIVPPLITYLLGYRQFKDLGDSADHITTGADTGKVTAITSNQLVWHYWNISNFIAYSLQLFFIFLILLHLKVERRINLFLLAIYSTWFLSIRLYVDWVQMPDPWAFTFLAIAAYCTLKRNTPGFIVSILLGSLCKEMLLFMLPTYIWRRATAKDSMPRRLAESFAAGAVPLLLFFWLREHPHFASEVLIPNSITAPEAPSWNRLLPQLGDYLYLIYYHYSYRLQLGPLYLLDILLIPIGTFAGLSALLLWSTKEAARTLLEQAYWLPFIALTAVVGINVDRYIFYIFPAVILLSGLVLQKRFHGKDLLYALILITAISAVSNELLGPFDTKFLSYGHQLELASTISEKMAWDYRLRILGITLAGIAGLYMIGRMAKKRDLTLNKCAKAH